MVNTLFDSNLGDVTSVKLANVTVTGTVTAANVAVSGTLTAGTVVGLPSAALTVSQIVAAGTITVGGLGVLYAVNPSINLSATTSALVSAYSMTAAINVIISASFTSGTPVVLPSVATWVGGEISVFNQSTHSVAVWPQPNDIIDSTATGAYVVMNSNVRAGFVAVSTTGIISYQYGSTAV